MIDEPRDILAKAAEQRQKAITPEQAQRRAYVDARNTALQQAGMNKELRQPSGGVWGGKVTKAG